MSQLETSVLANRSVLRDLGRIIFCYLEIEFGSRKQDTALDFHIRQ